MEDSCHSASPSSIEIRTWPSGDKAMAEIFFLFSNGSVRLLLLDGAEAASRGAPEITSPFPQPHSLDQIEHGHAVAHGAEDRIAIGREEHGALPVDGPAEVLCARWGL